MTEQLYRGILADKEGGFREVVVYVGMSASAREWDGPKVGFIPAGETIYLEELKEYLDTGILHWRAKQKLGHSTAQHFIDALQSVRSSILGSTLA